MPCFVSDHDAIVGFDVGGAEWHRRARKRTDLCHRANIRYTGVWLLIVKIVRSLYKHRLKGFGEACFAKILFPPSNKVCCVEKRRATMRRHRKKSGQSIVEFALVATLLLTLLLGLADFGLAFYARIVIKNAVSEGGYWAFQHPRNDAAVRNQIISEAAKQGITVASGNITVDCAGAAGAEQTTITLTYNHPLLFTWLIPSSSVPIGERVVMPQLGGC